MDNIRVFVGGDVLVARVLLEIYFAVDSLEGLLVVVNLLHCHLGDLF